MLVQLLAAAGVLAVLTMVPGPDTAVVTRRAAACGWRDGLRTVGGISAGLLARGVLTVAGPAAVLAASATAYTVVEPGRSRLPDLPRRAVAAGRPTCPYGYAAHRRPRAQGEPVADRPGQQRLQPEGRRLLHRSAADARVLRHVTPHGNGRPRSPARRARPRPARRLRDGAGEGPRALRAARGAAVHGPGDRRRPDRFRPQGRRDTALTGSAARAAPAPTGGWSARRSTAPLSRARPAPPPCAPAAARSTGS